MSNTRTKVVWSYTDLKTVADRIADQIDEVSIGEDFQLVAISRGGITAAHRIAYKLSKTLNFFSPAHKLLAFPLLPNQKVFFIEDLVAKGRTHNAVRMYMGKFYPTAPWEYCPLVVDSEFKECDFPIHGVVSHDWIVFPYEDDEYVKVGDHGLFREGSAQSALKGKT